MNRKLSRGFRLFIVSLLLLLLVSPPLLAQRDCCEGDSWLKWNSERRLAYVEGYIEGYYGGFFHGCQEGAKIQSQQGAPKPGELPINKCLNNRRNLVDGPKLVGEVTSFYTKYPKDRELLINEILEELGKGRTIEDIHSSPPFPVQDPAKSRQK